MNIKDKRKKRKQLERGNKLQYYNNWHLFFTMMFVHNSFKGKFQAQVLLGFSPLTLTLILAGLAQKKKKKERKLEETIKREI